VTVVVRSRHTLSWDDATVAEDFSGESIKAMKVQFLLEDKVSQKKSARSKIRAEFNVRPDPIDHRDLWYEPSLVEVPSYNTAEDLRAPDIFVRQQGDEGSCTGQALAAVVDLQNSKRFRVGADVPRRVSARMAYENARLYDEHPEDGLEGSSLRGAIKGFYHRGLCNAARAPYHSFDNDFEYNKEIADDARRVILGAYFRLRHVLNHYHTAITEVGAILCSAIIHEGWEHKNVEKKNGRIILRDDGSATRKLKLLGGHAFAIVGYDDDGFLVLNSWGRKWGNFDPTLAIREQIEASGMTIVPKEELKNIRNRKVVAFPKDLTEGSLPGVSHWSYEDWSRHVLDAWVLRLTAPTQKDAWYSGGFHTSSTEPADSSEAVFGKSSTPRSRAVVGHYIHVRDGELVDEPPYVNDLKTFKNTAKIIREANSKKRKYQHILLYAHGGLDSIESASARAAVMTSVFKRHGVYPVFFFWRTGFGNITQDVLRGLLPRVENRSMGSTKVTNHLLERMIEPIGGAIWRDIKKNAENCFQCPNVGDSECPRCGQADSKKCDRGMAWQALDVLLEVLREARNTDGALKLHLASHSAGVFMLGEMLRRHSREVEEGQTPPFDLKDLHTVSLFAPTCTDHYFRHAFGALRPVLSSKVVEDGVDFLHYQLPDLADKAGIDGALDPYTRSFPYLVSNALEDVRGTRIVGLEKHWDDLIEYETENLTAENSAASEFWKAFPREVLNERTTGYTIGHTQFDNSAGLMNRVLRRITGRSAVRGFRDEDLRDGRF